MSTYEQAMVICLGAGLVACMFSRSIRSALWGVVRILFEPKLGGVIVAYGLYLAGVAAAGTRVGIWEPALVEETAIWFAVIGMKLLMNTAALTETPGFLHRAGRQVLHVGLLTELLLTATLFPVWVWIPVILVTTALGALQAFAEARGDARVKSCLEVALGAVALLLLVSALIYLAGNFDDFTSRESLLSLGLPFWLGPLSLPFIFVVGLVMHYEQAFLRIDFKNEGSPARRRAKLATLIVCGARAHEVASVDHNAAYGVAHAASLREARAALREDLARGAEERRFAHEQEQRLERYAGVVGTDEDGRQLDRREFDATVEAFEYIASFMEGWYSNDGRYVDSHLQLLAPYPGLSDEHGIEVVIAENGQAWMGWRRTITGWVFAIGAAVPPKRLWRYDGAEPPTDFPGRDPMWQQKADNWDPVFVDYAAA